MKKILVRLKKRVTTLFSEFLYKKIHFLKGTPFLLCTTIINIVFLILWGVLYLKKGAIPWTVVIGFPLVSVSMCLAWYAQEFFSWCQSHSAKSVEKTVSAANAAFIFFLPAISFFVSHNLAKLFFEKPLSIIDIVGCCLLTVCQFVFVGHYCVELKDLTRPEYSSIFRAKFFLACIIHIAQLFADIYIVIFVMFPNSFLGIDTSSAFSISFDFTYFSTMTLLTAGSEIVAISRLAKSVVLIETFLFVIVISMVIFGIFSNNAEVNGDE